MGLDTSHDCWHGAYSAFSRWRQEIAKAAGYAVWEVKQPDGIHWPTIMLDWGHVTAANLMGEWETTPRDPLMVLFAHHDCEGLIHPQQASSLSWALTQVLPKLSSDPVGGHIGDMVSKTQRFIDGLNRAVIAGEDVVFS